MKFGLFEKIFAGLTIAFFAGLIGFLRMISSPEIIPTATTIIKEDGSTLIRPIHSSLHEPSAHSGVTALIFLVLAFGLYFLPAIYAIKTNHHRQALVILLNLTVGWTIIGWLVTFVVASTPRTPPTKQDQSLKGKLLELEELRNSGIVNDEEYAAKRTALLS